EATHPGAAAAACRTARTGSAPAPGFGRYRPVAAPTTSDLPSLRRSNRGGVPLTDSRLQERVQFVPAREVVLSDDATVSVQFAVRVHGRVVHVVDQQVDLILVDGVIGDGDRAEALAVLPIREGAADQRATGDELAPIRASRELVGVEASPAGEQVLPVQVVTHPRRRVIAVIGAETDACHGQLLFTRRYVCVM